MLRVDEMLGKEGWDSWIKKRGMDLGASGD